MTALDFAAKALYEHQLQRAGLHNAPSWGSISESDRELIRTEVRTVMRTFYLAMATRLEDDHVQA